MKDRKDNQGIDIDDAEKVKMANTIAEIDQILSLYNQTGYLDEEHRDRAIHIIMDTRREEPVVQIALMPKNPATAVPYQQLSTPRLCQELNYIKDYLEGKLAGKIVKGLTEGQTHDR